MTSNLLHISMTHDKTKIIMLLIRISITGAAFIPCQLFHSFHRFAHLISDGDVMHHFPDPDLWLMFPFDVFALLENGKFFGSNLTPTKRMLFLFLIS